ncbi:ephrin-B1-like [Montipora foliosa]|uniref:ephrin-B1-like n=1 Tax=Montipora foliosa TaxID=591990 RepID=UPI0035F13707
MNRANLLQMQCVVSAFAITQIAVGNSYLYPSIQWTHVNPLFKSNRTLCVYPHSTLYFLCPNTATAVVSLQINFLSPLYENLWLVNKESYERCEVNKTVDRKLRVCDKPFELKSYRIIFRRYSAGDDPLFTPGEDYYFIATSDGTKLSVYKTSGGHCETHNMKLKFHICMNRTDPLCRDEDLCNGEVPPRASTTVPTRASTTVSTSTKKPTTSQSEKNSTFTNFTVPTIQMTDKPGNPGNKGKIERNETAYHVSIAILVFFCVILTSVCVILLRRLYHKKKLEPSLSSNSSALSHDSPDGNQDSSHFLVNSV